MAAASSHSAVHLPGSFHPMSHEVPCTLVILGGAGDLGHKKLLPALYNLSLDGALGPKFAIMGFSLERLNDETYQQFARDGIEKFSRRDLTDAGWNKFAPLLHFVSGSFTEPADYQKLKQRLSELDSQFGTGGNHVFYFAIPPQFIDQCCAGLTQAGLIGSADGERGFTRAVIEKPIGHDLASAAEINNQLARYFNESQLFRIDHYLGKETVENLMVLRFANSIFEPIWNAGFVDHVQITVAEEEGVGTRATYYDEAGALRDMVQSHILQVLCMIAMEAPRSTHPDAVRDAKLDLLLSLRPFEPADVEKWVVRGQYEQGLVSGDKVASYRAEEHIPPDSNTETFVALKCYIENWRWAGVPFYLRTGKRMARRASEIAIQFKRVPRILYNSRPGPPLPANVLSIRIQPDEGLSVNIVGKQPGSPLRLGPVKVDFHSLTTSPEAYETLLRDVLAGDQTLFMRRDTVAAAWRFIQNILDSWAGAPGEPFLYPAGSSGPTEAAVMIARDGRAWRNL